MNDFVTLMWKPLIACFILTGIHTYLGIHVIERKVIFVDLALAQIAALGAVIALVFGVSLHGQAAYWFSLGATAVGAVIFSVTRMRKEEIPQEAMIGIVYAVSAAAAILILSRSSEGDEEIRHMLVGNILLVDFPEILAMAVLYGLVGFFHWTFRRKLILISTNPVKAYQNGIPVRQWDILFYLTFGVVVTSSVHIAGVLLVFSFLIVPAVGAILFSDKIWFRLFLGWIYGILASIVGIAMSYYFDFPTGATVICVLGGFLVLLILLKNTLGRRA